MHAHTSPPWWQGIRVMLIRRLLANSNMATSRARPGASTACSLGRPDSFMLKLMNESLQLACRATRGAISMSPMSGSTFRAWTDCHHCCKVGSCWWSSQQNASVRCHRSLMCGGQLGQLYFRPFQVGYRGPGMSSSGHVDCRSSSCTLIVMIAQLMLADQHVYGSP